MSNNSINKRLLVGQINGLFGVQGWVKLFSHTNPRKNILTYQPWHIEVDGKWTTLEIVKGRVQGKTIVAQLKGVDDREVARVYIGIDIYIERSQLAKLPKGEYYWDELTGLEVVNTAGVELGKISYMVDTGSNNVMVINGKKEHWVPYIEPFLINIDMNTRKVLVDWDEDF
ncbi:16S rRNA processing protein RimM [uncultured Gammaproteobacteria bacterium]|uniref:ribosome maturation factor RimM n=1 Tax=Bathymodiolus heckerae thiotrophic gill symbiont TaxID=1052212 RepID=UPI0010B7EF32|nr:ribosome maturation factor RimM [Bathymodiolus heckerae thiotrophic gill symbiont]CAC9949792.1 16S rRNA processing protein RimM [uncultured Gammaproteobacteria bacterium]CAC9965876.1 16S rRNA processing protein RimM [uncultured Gammaproteobacteria bacterium]SHN90878.1 16S rRNA processing protein RimM [Bathymodiolus heckerae thiotrophic gill symbiont]